MQTLIRNQGSIRHLFIVASRPLLFPVIIFLSCQIHQNVYLLLALRESIHRHSVPKLTASLVLYTKELSSESGVYQSKDKS